MQALAGSDHATELSHQFGVSVAVVHVLQWLKNSNLPGTRWITPDSTTVLRTISILTALLTSAGFKIMSGDADHGFTLFIPPVAIIVDTLVHAVAQFGAQQGYYSVVYEWAQKAAKVLPPPNANPEPIKNYGAAPSISPIPGDTPFPPVEPGK